MEITRKLLVLVQTASSVAARLKAAPDSAAGCASLVQLGVSSASNENPPYLSHNGAGVPALRTPRVTMVRAVEATRLAPPVFREH
jgi:hypothetical protein